MAGKVRMKGRTTEEAVKAALEVLKASRDDVEIRIISEGEAGVLGVFGGKEAEVEVFQRLTPEEEAKGVLQDILDKAGFIANVYVEDTKNAEDTICLEIKGDEIPRMIGKEGQTLDALQYITSIIANKGKEQRKRVLVEAGGYRKKQESRTEKIAKESIEEALISGKEVILPAMTARERRIIHLAVKQNSKLTSYSTGEKGERRVVIAPNK
ncbi:MAG: RNA-binding cell elongation regulator Jag/EloR [Candidatus Margulisiibacteriota bacterium]